MGGVESITVTYCTSEAVFPLRSVAVQVTAVMPIGNTVGALLLIEGLEQLSVAVAVPSETPVAWQAVARVATLTSAGAVITGATDSKMVINCVAVVVFPAASLTVQITVVLPMAKVSGALLLILLMLQLSEVAGVPSDNPVR